MIFLDRSLDSWHFVVNPFLSCGLVNLVSFSFGLLIRQARNAESAK